MILKINFWFLSILNTDKCSIPTKPAAWKQIISFYLVTTESKWQFSLLFDDVKQESQPTIRSQIKTRLNIIDYSNDFSQFFYTRKSWQCNSFLWKRPFTRPINKRPERKQKDSLARHLQMINFGYVHREFHWSHLIEKTEHLRTFQVAKNNFNLIQPDFDTFKY